MESRKVQRSGNSSFVISLPAEWVRAYGIRKNSPIPVSINQDGSLTIYPKAAKKEAERPLCLVYRDSREQTAFLRRMIGAYIAGCQSIEIKTDDRGYKDAVALVSEFTSMTVGQEVVEETPQRILVKDILSPSELPMEKALLRMSNISKKMFSDSLSALGHGGEGTGAAMQQMEKDIDRLWRLMARKHNLFLRFPSTASGEGISLPKAHLYFLSARITERVADHAVLIGNAISPAMALRKAAGFAGLSAIGQECEGIYERATKAVFSLDAAMANAVIDEANLMEGRFERLLGQGQFGSARLVSIKHDIRRVAAYGAEMCENVIDFAASG